MFKAMTLKRNLVFIVVFLVASYLATPALLALRMNMFLNHYDEQHAFIFFIGDHPLGGVDCPIQTCPECKIMLRELLDSLSECSYSKERPPDWMYRICIQNDADGNWIYANIVGEYVYFSIRDSYGVYRTRKAIAFQEVVKKVLEYEVDGVKIDIRSPIFKP